MPCPTCTGKGLVLVDLNSFRLGDGFRSFLSAGTRVVHGEDGSCYHEIVCPACDGGKVYDASPETEQESMQ